eukprot:TRINITY_DN39733_c0_g1_i1.p1 TRINITY_DN39733_c0_g1~~TRINITY_DN39733_c0_g1_i1.p1  ORF type:complete len:457 (+),score=157.16 TRINITY_DN39733_c0_g1_i1:29-1372(+)
MGTPLPRLLWASQRRGIATWDVGISTASTCGQQDRWAEFVKKKLAEEDFSVPVASRTGVRGAVRAAEVTEASKDFPWSDSTMAEYTLNTLEKESPGYKVTGRHIGIDFVKEIFEELKGLEKLGCTIGPKTFAALINHALLLWELESMQFLWEELVRRRINPPLKTWSKIILFHAKGKSLNAVRASYQAFADCGGDPASLHITYLKALILCGCRQEAMSFFRSVESPNRPLYSMAIQACSSYEEGRALLKEMEEKGVGVTIRAYESLLTLLASLPDSVAAEKVFAKVAAVSPPTQRCWTVLFYAYRTEVDLHGGLAVLQRMQDAREVPLSIPVALVELCTGVRKKIASEHPDLDIRGEGAASLPPDKAALLHLADASVSRAEKMAARMYVREVQYKRFFEKVLNRHRALALGTEQLKKVRHSEREKRARADKLEHQFRRGSRGVVKQF